MGEHGRAKWNELLPLLQAEKGERFGRFDIDALTNYCEAFQDKRDNQAILDKAGKTVCSGPNGALYPHPAVGMRNQADKRMKTWGDVLEINFNRRKAKKPSDAIPQKRKPA